ncbi:MAG: hypothetical protein LIO69_07630 [Oscillospiraceae bacterium]|nr:hypothetical protein [Oscillospiraceae bacterium]
MKKEEKPHFFDRLYSAQEIILVLNGKKYCVQGFHENNLAHMYLQQWEPEIDDAVLWSYSGNDMVDCGDNFLDAKVFNGKSFWEVEKEIEWVDE